MPFRTFLVQVFCLFFAQTAWGQTSLPPMALAARSWILFDASTTQVLREYHADQRINADIFGRLLLAYITFDALHRGQLQPGQILPMPAPVAAARPSSAIPLGKQLSVQEALQALLLPGGTRAARGIAAALAGPEPAIYRRFDREAQRIGLEHTQFRNLGTQDAVGHYTTARDLTLLAARLQRDFPEQSQALFQRTDLVINGQHWPNPNHLLWLDPTVDGLIGSDAGWVASATRGSRHLIAIVLDDASPERIPQECLQLLNSGFQDFETVRLYTAGQNIRPLEVRYGRLNYVKTGFLQDFSLALAQGNTDDLQLSLSTRNPLQAPVRKGDVLGTLTITQDLRLIGTYPISALEDVPATNWLGRRWDDLKNWLRQEK